MGGSQSTSIKITGTSYRHLREKEVDLKASKKIRELKKPVSSKRIEFKVAEEHLKALNKRLDHISEFEENSVFNENRQHEKCELTKQIFDQESMVNKLQAELKQMEENFKEDVLLIHEECDLEKEKMAVEFEEDQRLSVTKFSLKTLIIG